MLISSMRRVTFRIPSPAACLKTGWLFNVEANQIDQKGAEKNSLGESFSNLVSFTGTRSNYAASTLKYFDHKTQESAQKLAQFVSDVSKTASVPETFNHFKICLAWLQNNPIHPNAKAPRSELRNIRSSRPIASVPKHTTFLTQLVLGPPVWNALRGLDFHSWSFIALEAEVECSLSLSLAASMRLSPL